MPTAFEWTITALLPATVTCVAFYILPYSESYFTIWILYMILDATYGYLFHMLLLMPARWIAHRLPGSEVPPLTDEEKLVVQEEEMNDPSVVWPSSHAIAKLPPGWIVEDSSNGKIEETVAANEINTKPKSQSSASKKRRSAKAKTKATSANSAVEQSQSAPASKSTKTSQPYYLNHVRGSTRIRQASQRIGAAMGTLLSSYLICSISPLVNFDSVGLKITSVPQVLIDVTCGVGIGSLIVTVIFSVELGKGWITIVAYFDTVVPNEVFAINFLWDVLFHVGVSINEEIMLRGWMFTLGVRGLQHTSLDWFDDPINATTHAIVMSIILQSTLFAMLHYHSPGSSAVSLANLFFGGIAASLNVMASGGSVWLGVGWHFGWNIMMGHVLGRSTSGIPMSCAVVNVIPHPDSPYVKYHGGMFGPEQGVLAPLAYILGMILVVWVYGLEDLISWRDSLV